MHYAESLYIISVLEEVVSKAMLFISFLQSHLSRSCSVASPIRFLVVSDDFTGRAAAPNNFAPPTPVKFQQFRSFIYSILIQYSY